MYSECKDREIYRDFRLPMLGETIHHEVTRYTALLQILSVGIPRSLSFVNDRAEQTK